jgi:HEAT repeat protein
MLMQLELTLVLVLWAILTLIVLNVLVVGLTLETKISRSIVGRKRRSRTDKLQHALVNSLTELHPDLRDLGRGDSDVLTGLMVDYLSLLQRGAGRDRLVQVAEETGLVDRSLEDLNSWGRRRKAQAAQGLGYFGGSRAVAPLTELLGDRDETLRATAARALGRIGTPEAVEALARTLDDPSEITRLRMADNLERLGPVAIGPLLSTLEGGEPHARVLAVRVLGNLRAAEARPALRDAIQDDGPLLDVRAQAALALGKVSDPDDVPALQMAAEDEAWPVRAQAANALGIVGDASRIPTLQRLALDGEWWVRLNACRALASMGPAGEEALVDMLGSEDHPGRDPAAATLEDRGLVRRWVGELATPGEEAEKARSMIRAMIGAGTTKHLECLVGTFPDERARSVLRRTMVEDRGA